MLSNEIPGILPVNPPGGKIAHAEVRRIEFPGVPSLTFPVADNKNTSVDPFHGTVNPAGEPQSSSACRINVRISVSPSVFAQAPPKPAPPPRLLRLSVKTPRAAPFRGCFALELLLL
jgi:hypothetical protein